MEIIEKYEAFLKAHVWSKRLANTYTSQYKKAKKGELDDNGKKKFATLVERLSNIGDGIDRIKRRVEAKEEPVHSQDQPNVEALNAYVALNAYIADDGTTRVISNMESCVQNYDKALDYIKKYNDSQGKNVSKPTYRTLKGKRKPPAAVQKPAEAKVVKKRKRVEKKIEEKKKEEEVVVVVVEEVIFESPTALSLLADILAELRKRPKIL